MNDHAEEQEMEAEAMAAIFDSHFEILNPSEWQVTVYPETGTTDEQELENINHVGCRLIVTLPETYPEVLPNLDIEVIKGLASEHQEEILNVANEEAAANIGAPSIFAITERIREWLVENNVKGLDDVSMHAQMMRKKALEEKAKVSSVVLWILRLGICLCFSFDLSRIAYTTNRIESFSYRMLLVFVQTVVDQRSARSHLYPIRKHPRRQRSDDSNVIWIMYEWYNSSATIHYCLF